MVQVTSLGNRESYIAEAVLACGDLRGCVIQSVPSWDLLRFTFGQIEPRRSQGTIMNCSVGGFYLLRALHVLNGARCFHIIMLFNTLQPIWEEGVHILQMKNCYLERLNDQPKTTLMTGQRWGPCLVILQSGALSPIPIRVSVQFSLSVVSDSLRPHESQHTRPPCPSPTPGVHPNSCASSRWCHPAISSSVIPFSSCPQFLPASESSNESTLCMRWPKYWSFSFSISPSKEIPGLISFRTDWLDVLAVQGTLKSLLQHHSSKASILSVVL